MNEVFLFCEACLIYRNAGYRHACQALSDCGLIQEDLLAREPFYARVEYERVMACGPYWAEENASGELGERLRRARAFMLAHAGHPLSFGDVHRIFSSGSAWFDWMNEDGDEDPSPRYLAERMRLANWSEVDSMMAARRPPWWWSDDSSETRTAAKQKFEALVASGKP